MMDEMEIDEFLNRLKKEEERLKKVDTELREMQYVDEEKYRKRIYWPE